MTRLKRRFACGQRGRDWEHSWGSARFVQRCGERKATGLAATHAVTEKRQKTCAVRDETTNNTTTAAATHITGSALFLSGALLFFIFCCNQPSSSLLTPPPPPPIRPPPPPPPPPHQTSCRWTPWVHERLYWQLGRQNRTIACGGFDREGERENTPPERPPLHHGVNDLHEIYRRISAVWGAGEVSKYNYYHHHHHYHCHHVTSLLY